MRCHLTLFASLALNRYSKKPKDPNAPKRPQTAYFLYTNDRRADLKAEHPDWKVSDIAKHLGAEWKNLTDAQKAPYVASAAKLKEKVRVRWTRREFFCQ